MITKEITVLFVAKLFYGKVSLNSALDPFLRILRSPLKLENLIPKLDLQFSTHTDDATSVLCFKSKAVARVASYFQCLQHVS